MAVVTFTKRSKWQLNEILAELKLCRGCGERAEGLIRTLKRGREGLELQGGDRQKMGALVDFA